MDENKTQNIENSSADKAPENKQDKNPNKITIFEVFVGLLLVFCIGLYLSPNIFLKLDNKRNAQMQTNASIFTSKALGEFSSNSKIKASDVAKKICKELNAVNKNPYDKKNPAYSIKDKCLGCVVITPDDFLNSVAVEAYSNDNILLVRTVIQPPSFVTYTRDLTSLDAEKEKGKKDGK